MHTACISLVAPVSAIPLRYLAQLICFFIALLAVNLHTQHLNSDGDLVSADDIQKAKSRPSCTTPRLFYVIFWGIE